MTTDRETSADWQRLYSLLEQAHEAARPDGRAEDVDKNSLLQERAIQLAQEPESPTNDHQIPVVEFMLARERYAVETAYVLKVYPLRNLTPVPCTPSFVLGVTNVRGQILSVIDLKKFFDLPDQDLTDLNRILILSDGRMEFGILADDILGTWPLAWTDIQPPPGTLKGIQAEYLLGVTAERLIVLDAQRILEDEKLIVHDQVAG